MIGLELGMVYQSFGVAAHGGRAHADSAAGRPTPTASKVVERTLVKRGATVLKSAKAEGVERRSDGSLGVRIVTTDGRSQTVECDTVLVAVGMKPRARGIGLEELGVKIDARGFIPTDERCQTNVAGRLRDRRRERRRPCSRTRRPRRARCAPR